MPVRFYVCQHGEKLYLRQKVNQAIAKAHRELMGTRHTFSLRVNDSNRPLMCFKCGVPERWRPISGKYQLTVRSDYIDMTFRPRRTK